MVHGRRRFVHDNDRRPSNQSPSENEDLTLTWESKKEGSDGKGNASNEPGEKELLTLGEIRTSGRDYGIEGDRHGRVLVSSSLERREPRSVKGVVQNGVVVFLEGIEVVSKGSRKKDGILRDDGDARSEGREVDVPSVEPVDEDSSLRGHHAKESESERTFTGWRKRRRKL